MKINSPFQLNDWRLSKFLKVILVLQFAMWIAIALDAIGFKIPIIRQFIGFFYLTFVPGILILRVFKLHKLGNIETILYTVGLSITTLMFTGLFMNFVYPFFGISKPLSNLSFIVTISILVLVLCVLSYARDKDFSNPTSIIFDNLFSLPALFLLLIPFLSIFGTYLYNFYNSNFLLMFLIIMVSIVCILIGFDIFIPMNLYSLAIFVISLSLLYHRSLISMYLWGWDIHIEYYFSNLVMIDSFWNSWYPSSANAMLSVTMLGPIYSHMCNLSLIWVFKIIYPLLFSLVPLGLYRVIQKQTDNKIAFLSSFFFMAVPTFFASMIQLVRQQIAELFLILLILLMVDKEIHITKRSILYIIFSFSLVVSHYGLSYIYMLSLIFVYPILFLMENQTIQGVKATLYRRFSNSMNNDLKSRNISPGFILLFMIFTLTWYIYISSSSAFVSFVRIGDHIVSTLFTQFLNPEAAQGLKILLMDMGSPLREIYRVLHILSQFLIVVGILTSSLNVIKVKFGKEYMAFAIINLALVLAGIAIPYFASSLQTTRLYHITLFFLAPFCVIGGIATINKIQKVSGKILYEESMKNSLKLLSIFFAIFLLFTSGFIFEIANDNPWSASSILLDNTFDYPRFNDKEVNAAKWLVDVTDSSPIYADNFGRLLLYEYNFWRINLFFSETEELPSRSYVYLRSLNLKGFMTELYEKRVGFTNSTFYNKVITRKNKIYDNGGSVIYH